MTIRPTLVEGIQITATAADVFEVALTGRATATLPRPVVAIALLFDGERTIEAVTAEVERWGAALPRPDFVGLLAEQLAAAGLVRLSGQAMNVARTHRYSCLQCGNSCRGPEIGPLPAGRAEIVEAQFAELVELGLQPPSPAPIRRSDDGQAWLARHDGACTFLGDDQLCRIHARFGEAAKPVACWLFPVVAAHVDGAVRVGISSSCIRHHQSFDDPDATVDLVEVFSRAEAHGVRAMRRTYRSAPKPKRGPRQRRERARSKRAALEISDDALLAWLHEHGVSLGALASLCASARLPDPAGDTLADEAVVDLRAMARSWARLTRVRVDQGRYPRAIPPGTRRAAAVALLSDQLLAAPLHAETLADLPPRWASYLAYRLSNHVFLRAGHGQGDLKDALLLFLVGAAVAVWIAREAEDERSAYDRFGETLVVWSLAVDGHYDAGEVLGTPDRISMMARWAG